MKLQPNEIWNEYQKIKQYCSSKNLYEDVKKQEDFYTGKQWGDLENDGTMPHPVINVIKMATKHHIAILSSNDVAISMIPFSVNETDADALKPIEEEVERVIESAKIKEKAKKMIRNGAVDGSAYLLFTFDADYETHQPMKGRIECQLIDNTNVYYGNPYSNETQKQPYIIVALRQNLEQVKHEAKELGLKQEQIDMIVADNDQDQANDDSDNLVTVLLKFYKETKEVEEIELVEENGIQVEFKTKKKVSSIHFLKTTKQVTLIKPTDLGYTMYPIARFGWEELKNSYLFISPFKEVIPNQVFINKMEGLSMMYAQNNAIPKTIIDDNKIALEDFLDSDGILSVSGLDMAGKFWDFVKSPDYSPQVQNTIDNAIRYTKESLGVNDALLGNVKPENTSAIIALQESSNAPLEIQRQEFYEMWEDAVRIILDIMSCDYGERKVLTEVDGKPDMALVKFDLLKSQMYDLKVDIGNSAQFSEVAQMQVNDNLFAQQVIDAKTFVENTPDKYIKNKNKVLKNIDEMMLKAQQEQMAQMPQQI